MSKKCVGDHSCYISGEVEKDSRGYVRVNENLQSVSVSNVYAIGDIANFPLCLPSWKDTCNDYTTAIGHWQLALRCDDNALTHCQKNIRSSQNGAYVFTTSRAAAMSYRAIRCCFGDVFSNVQWGWVEFDKEFCKISCCWQLLDLSEAKALRPRARLNLPAAFSSYFTTRSSG